jgi:phosphatidate phosphatase APP1
MAGVETTTETDDDGYFHARLRTSLDGSDRWVEGVVGLSAPYRNVSDRSSPVSVMVPQPGARFGVISDIDDTILETATLRPLTMARNTFTGSAVTRIPMTGVPEWYRGLAADGLNPVYYVSSSPWNLYGMLTGFIEHRGLPVGPLLLRDFLGTDKSRTHRSHKTALIEEILAMNRGLSFVLVGDSGQEDPEIYAEISKRHPDQVRAIYIRSVHRRPSRALIETGRDADSPFVFAEDTGTMAQHSAEIGLVEDNTVADVRRALTS